VFVLKKCKGCPQPACVPELLLLDKKGYPLQPQVILGHKIIKKKEKW